MAAASGGGGEAMAAPGYRSTDDSTGAESRIKVSTAFGVSSTSAKLAQAAALWVMPPVAVASGLFAAFLFATGVCATRRLLVQSSGHS